MTNPLVSVLMTAYNRDRYIGEAIESVTNSTYENWELIIVDDCSKDDTVAIGRAYAKDDNRITVFVNEKNLGDYPNRNKAACYASGEYIIYCDSDDILYPESIEKILDIIRNVPGFNFAMYWSHTDKTFSMESQKALRKHFFEQQFLYMGPGGTFMRRSFFNKIGGYPEKYGPANDMYFNLKAVCNSSITLIPFQFNFYRIHEGQEINNKFGYMYNNYLYMRDALNELPLSFSKKEINWLLNKNKRRFFLHLLRFFLKTLNFPKTIFALRKTSFSFRDVFDATFNGSAP